MIRGHEGNLSFADKINILVLIWDNEAPPLQLLCLPLQDHFVLVLTVWYD